AGIFYHTYSVAPRLFGFPAVADQQLAGGILAVPGNIVDLVLMSLVFFGWVNQMERTQRARERRMYGEERSAESPVDEDAVPAPAPADSGAASQSATD
ncbi:MAG TPA: hypothetical protein VFN78_14800, partial [Ktedonobacterales bacterium]|nr:hypothetical protein [Ktedonobacterales bacterium]